MSKMSRLVHRTKDVVAFVPRGAEGVCASKMLVDRESVGSETFTLNQFTLHPGKATSGGAHPAPYDEFYYVLSGRGLLHLGNPAAGDPAETFDLEPGAYAFIPGGTIHALTNTGEEDLELLTGMPYQLPEGINGLYDERKRTWGTSWKVVGETR
jgi:mannose-6-phosphate isomerase-like protein (cupin superfamily)